MIDYNFISSTELFILIKEMSRTRNSKRAKALHQKKTANQKPIKKIESRINDISINESDGTVIIDRAMTGSKYKISQLVIEMVQPILDTANDREEIRGILSLGVVAWNCGILKEKAGEIELRKVLRKFNAREFSSERRLLDEFIDIKCTKYKVYSEFIIDYRLSMDSGSFNFTVTTALDDKTTEEFLNEN